MLTQKLTAWHVRISNWPCGPDYRWPTTPQPGVLIITHHISPQPGAHHQRAASQCTINMLLVIAKDVTHCGLRAVMHVLRKHAPVIVGLLQAILADPFVEWTAASAFPKSSRAGRPRGGRPQSGGAIAVNQHAAKAMATVQGRLQGVLAGARSKRCRPMTVDAHVDFLLAEAQEAANLSRMFIGWLPFM